MLQPRLPVEIWTVIIEDLPRTSQRSCLSVSRLLHDIAIRPLFSKIKLYYLLRNDSRTRDILDRLASDGEFARSVKSLVVIPTRLVEGWELAKAIESMSQLVSFQWFGEAVYFSKEVAEAIASLCPQLRELALPADCRDGIVFHTPLLNLHNLHALRISWAWPPHLYYPTSMAFRLFNEADNKFDLDGQLQMIDANQNTLRELHIISCYLDKVPVRIFNLLTHLEIHIPSEHEFSDLSFVFRHTVHLESLILMGPGSPITPLFDTNTETLPSLSSLHLSMLYLPSSQIWWNICDFVRHKVSLQRICLRLYRDWPDSCEILAIIKDLPALRVLGLEILDSDADLEFLALNLPPTLESLHLVMPWNRKASFASLRRALPNLTFLLLAGAPMTAQEVAHDMKHLRVVGCRDLLWDIVRVGNDEILLPSNLSDTKWRVEGCYTDEDGAWLLKYF